MSESPVYEANDPIATSSTESRAVMSNSRSSKPRQHHLVSPPKYIRTQSIGLLSRSKTLSNNLHAAPAIRIPDGAGTDKRHQRTSVAFPAAAEHEVLPGPPQRPLKRRSDSLPAFPMAPEERSAATLRSGENGAAGIPRERRSMIFEYGQPCAVSELPADPKTWTPSQLSVYLAHVLKLVPRAVQADITRFVVKCGLTGKRFLRMRDQDLVAMGINISWCRIFSTARERLRKEALRGRIFGSSSPVDASSDLEGSTTESDIMSLFLRPPRPSDSEDSPNAQYKQNSWRRKEGKKSRGRVKGIAKVFEEEKKSNEGLARSKSFRQDELDEVRRVRRMRGSSTDSELSSISADSSFSDAQAEVLGPPVAVTQEEKEHSGTPALGQREDPFDTLPTWVEDATKDWSQVEPLTLEDTSFLPAQFLTPEAQNAFPPPTPISGLPDLPEIESEDTSFVLESEGSHTPSIIVDPVAPTSRDDGMEHEQVEDDLETKVAPMPFADEKYQSRILAHGREAYSPISRRGSTSSYFPKLPLSPAASAVGKDPKNIPDAGSGSAFSEITDEVSEEHLAFWLKDQQRNSPCDSPAFSPGLGLPKSSSEPSMLEIAQVASSDLPLQDGLGVQGDLVFAADEDGKKLTVKRLDSTSISSSSKGIRPRSHSNDNLRSLRLSSVATRGSSSGGKNRGSLKGLFDEASAGKEDGEQSVVRQEDEIMVKMKGQKDGSMVIMSRAELEQMQAKLQDLELRLAASESQYSRSSSLSAEHRSLSAAEKSQAMSSFVRDALGEAGTFAMGGRDTSWVGLGGWALAAGLGVGIVVGEAMLGKLRR